MKKEEQKIKYIDLVQSMNDKYMNKDFFGKKYERSEISII